MRWLRRRASAALGIKSILTKLGENLTRVEEAEEVTRHYLDALDRIKASRLPAQISVKPTQLGLDLGMELCSSNLQRIVDRAAERDTFVWIDMESSAYVDPDAQSLPAHTRPLVADRRRTAGVPPSHRSGPRIAAAAGPGHPHRQRRVSGTAVDAFQRKADVDGTSTSSLPHARVKDPPAGTLLHIATHDERLINRLAAFIDEHRCRSSAYDAQCCTAFSDRCRDGSRAYRPACVAICKGNGGFRGVHANALSERARERVVCGQEHFARYVGNFSGSRGGEPRGS